MSGDGLSAVRSKSGSGTAGKAAAEGSGVGTTRTPGRRGRERNVELSDYLGGLRARANPALFHKPAGSKVTQVDVARKMGISPGWLATLESGCVRVTRGVVEDLVRVYKLPHTKVIKLYSLALGWEPDVTVAVATVDETSTLVVDLRPSPTYLSDPIGTILYTNQAFQAWWPAAEVGDNFRRLILIDPQTHKRLPTWENWATSSLAQLRIAQLQLPAVYGDRLTRLLDECCVASPRIDTLARGAIPTKVCEDGDERTMLCPCGREVTVALSVSEPGGLPFYRLVSMIPLNMDHTCASEADASHHRR